jgi:phage terminase large subunit-like protein
MRQAFFEAVTGPHGPVLMDSIDREIVRELNAHFPTFHHDGQLPPEGLDWRTWLIIAGRGYGKTRAGAEWVLSLVRAMPGIHIALVGSTIDEARKVMVDGDSGLRRLAAEGEIADRPVSGRTLLFANGAEATLYSGANPESLRGPQHHFAWADELAKWRHPKATWDNLQLGLRLGEFPRAVVTTTPKPSALLRRLRDAPDSVETGGATGANPHLPSSFVAAMHAQYGGTRAGLQEIEGRLLDDFEGSLWPLKLIERCRVLEPPALTRTVIGVDPPASAGGTCGIVVCALARDGNAYVIADCSVSGASPEGWARSVADAAARYDADRVVAEKNQGGDMVRSVLLAASAILPLELVHAAVGKAARAEPVAALFENGRAYFAGHFAELEAQLGGMVAGGDYQGDGRSPDRADAMVWALWALLLKPQRGEPRISLP